VDVLCALRNTAVDAVTCADAALSIQLRFCLLFRAVASPEEMDGSFARNYARLVKANIAFNKFGV
jgi:hypothetical protein